MASALRTSSLSGGTTKVDANTAGARSNDRRMRGKLRERLFMAYLCATVIHIQGQPAVVRGRLRHALARVQQPRRRSKKKGPLTRAFHHIRSAGTIAGQ